MELIKHVIEDDIWQYEFKEDETSYVITVLIHENTALFIDTGYERHMDEVLSELKAEGIAPAVQVISHYHPDHCSGLHRLMDIEIIASGRYLNNFNNCREWCPEQLIPHPTQTTDDLKSLKFGKRQLRFLEMEGHAIGHLVTRIDDGYLHMGDLLMRTASGLLSLPCLCEDGHVIQHQRSLEYIRDMEPRGLLLAHGAPLLLRNEIEENIGELLYYLKALAQGQDSQAVEAYLPKAASYYGFARFHKNNLKHSPYEKFGDLN